MLLYYYLFSNQNLVAECVVAVYDVPMSRKVDLTRGRAIIKAKLQRGGIERQYVGARGCSKG